MNWIKENKFVAGLAAITLVLSIALVSVGMKSSGNYEAAQEAYSAALEKAEGYEKIVPYPTQENVAAKKVALTEYRKQTEKLQQAFESFRPGELPSISPQDFANKLKEAREETMAAFGDDAVVPENYFLGFKDYRTSLASGSATGILVYQLDAVKRMMVDMAESGVTQLINIHRPRLPEEDGEKFEAEENQVARELPLELTFRGPEEAVRKFLSTLVNDDERFIVVRSMSIRNSNPEPPNSSDAAFERRAAAGAAPAAVAQPALGAADFSSLFDGAGEKPAEEAPAPAPADSSRVLSQVLGNEEVTVFVRIDILGFLPPIELP